MLRVSSKVVAARSPNAKVLWRCRLHRYQSTQTPRKGGPATKILIATAGTTSLIGGVIGYSAWSPANRKVVQEKIPYSEVVLNGILGPLIESAHQPVIPTKTGQKSYLQKKFEGKQKEVVPGVTVEKIGEALPEPVSDVLLEATKEAAAVVVTGPSEEDLAAQAENAAFMTLLEDFQAQARSNITAALSAAEDAVAAIKSHAEQAFKAIESDTNKEDVYNAVAELAKLKTELINGARDKIMQAEERIEELRNQIAGKQSSIITSKNMAAAENALDELSYAINNIRTVVTDAMSDSQVIGQFGELVAAGRRQLESEIRSLLPELKLGETSDKLSTAELNILIAHAHRKIMQLQTIVAKQQTVDLDKMKGQVQRHRDSDAEVAETRLQVELDKQRHHLHVQYRQQMAELEDELEGELRSQLKRQAAAHSDHLNESLKSQQIELDDRWTRQLSGDIQVEKDKFHSSLTVLRGQLEGLKAAITSRADIDKAAHSARELWLACESLRSALNPEHRRGGRLSGMRLGSDEAKSWEEKILPLTEQVNAITAVAGESNTYVKVVLGSVSEEALSRGVYTEEALKERFIKINRICKRVSMISDNGGSLIRYLLSYLQSFLLVGAFDYLPAAEIQDKDVAVDKFTTYDILSRARYCLDKDDLEQALRYMNLLRGEPRNVASDWLREARLTLETRQVADALLAFAAATAVKAL